MQIKKNSIVTMDYVLRDDENTIIDKSGDSGPFPYIHGSGGIIPGLEAAMEGKKAGDKVKARISPEEGYGERDDSLLQSVPRNNFQGIDDISVGMQFQTPMEDGSQQVVTVITVDDEQVTVDGNHPLAGVPLNFEVTVVDVRDATDEELEHGHVHGPGGHEH